MKRIEPSVPLTRALPRSAFALNVPSAEQPRAHLPAYPPLSLNGGGIYALPVLEFDSILGVGPEYFKRQTPLSSRSPTPG